MNRIGIALAAFGGLAITFFGLFMIGFAADAGADGASFRNVSESMAPALLAGEYFTIRAVQPHASGSFPRGALVAHRSPVDPNTKYVKRIVAVPGDTIAMVGRRLLIDGAPVPEPYAWYADTAADPAWDEFQWQQRFLARPASGESQPYRPSRSNWGPLVVPVDHYFVLGDNRDNSLDSRFFGFVRDDDVRGLPRRVYMSRDPANGHIRLGRIGHLLE